MNLSSQKKIAAKILKVGKTRVRFNPEKLSDVSGALTRDDVRSLINSNAVLRKPAKGNSRGRFRAKKKAKEKGRRKGSGRREGTSSARAPKKRRWITKIRALRDELKNMREKGEITASDYRRLYIQAKGNLFQSRRHLHEHIKRVKE
ncbi:MAG: 50S ribosomal protein L19e [Candidatus Altiarchaeota archaeon]|nr:50S ribosomal protein L19e [Candidatus Altiarchaeota archaeon]